MTTLSYNIWLQLPIFPFSVFVWRIAEGQFVLVVSTSLSTPLYYGMINYQRQIKAEPISSLKRTYIFCNINHYEVTHAPIESLLTIPFHFTSLCNAMTYFTSQRPFR